MKNKLPISKFDTKEIEKKDHVLSQEDMQKVSFVQQRFTKMKGARTNVDKNWEIYQRMINADFEPYPDERSSSVVPLASAMIELFVAEANKIETIYQFKSETQKHATQAKAVEYVRKYDFRRNNRKKVFTENEYITGGFGTSVIYTGYEQYMKSQFDPKMGDDGSVVFEEKEFSEEKIIVENVDIRNFYVDNQAIKGIEDAIDCIWVQREPIDRFKNKKTSSVYKNIDKVTPIEFSNEDKTFVMVEEVTKTGDFVKTFCYWNVERDMYVEIANGILVREHPMMSTINGKKALPFVIRNLGYKNYSIYGRGLCEAMMMFNSELNTLRELLMDGIRRSNSQVLAIGNGLTFNGREFSYDNEILTFDGNLANNFQQISGNPPNQAIFNYMTQLYKDIAVFVGLDIQNIIGEPSQTAYQTEVQREASQKRINVWIRNRDTAYERFADLYKDLLQLYFPKKTAEGLYPTIEIEGEEMIGKGENAKFRKKKGKHIFEVTPEILRGDINIDVHTNLNAPTINVVDRQQKMELLTQLPQIAQAYAMSKQAGMDIDTILPIKKTLQDLAASYNLEPKGESDQETEDAKKIKEDLYKELQNMMSGGQPMPGEEQPQQPMEQEAEPEGVASPLSSDMQPGQNIL